MKVKVTCMAVLFFMALQFSFAQEKTVTGTVKDAAGIGLPGVAVLVKGEGTGTQTDFDGNYSIKAAVGNVLEFQYLGMKTTERTVGTANKIDITMEEDAQQLDEVVVTGLGTATDRRKVAISVETVNEESLKRIPVKSIDAALTGKVAGAQIQSISGQPGQSANIILRGINSLGSTQPMIMIDGVQVNASNNALGGGRTGGNISSRLADLDLSNVERVEVIQGAAAATIYGAQGANGVIQIFTKRGKSGQRTEITFNTSLSVDNALTGKFKKAKNHYFATIADGRIDDGMGNAIAVDPATGLWSLPDQTVTANTINDKPYVEQTYDHLKQYFNTAYTKQHSLNVTGASGNVDYSFGMSYLGQESVVNGDYNRKNLTANLGIELFKGFTLRSNTQLVDSENTTGGINGRNNVFGGMSQAMMALPFVDLTFVDGLGNPFLNYDANDNGVMPFYSYKFRNISADVKRVIQGIMANYKVNNFIEFDYKYGVDHYRYDYVDFIKNQESNAVAGGITPFAGSMTKDLIQETQQNSLISAFFKFDFAKDFNWKFPLQSTTQVAYDWRKRDYNRTTAIGTGYGVDPPFTLGTANSRNTEEYISEFVTFGYLVNQKFDYANLMGVSFGFRSDYSSAFGEGSKPFTFPRGDIYFRLSEVLKSPTIYEFKLRSAYGEAGIQPSAYDRMITLSSSALGNQGYFYLPAVARNTSIGVEKTKELEIGLDYGFRFSNGNWFNKASGSVVYWDRTSNGVVYTIDTPPSQGSSGIRDNAIDLASDGIQASLNLNVYQGENFEWTFGANFSKGKTIVDRISNGLPIIVGSAGSGQTSLIEGQPVGAFFGVKPRTSLSQTNSAGTRYIDAADEGNYEIVNGMVVETATRHVQFTSEQEKIGDATPDFSMSFFNDFRIGKNLNVSFQLDWVKGNEVYNVSRQWLYRDRIHGDLDTPVTIGGQSAQYVDYYVSLYNTNNVNSFFVEDASFWRLRDVSVSYDFSSFLENTFVKGVTLTASARNVFTITNYSGLDPEAVGTNLNDPLYRGIDLWSFPNMRSVNFALNVRF